MFNGTLAAAKYRAMTAMEQSIMGFIPRYQEYSTARDQTENLIKDLMIHCEKVESAYKYEVETLRNQLTTMTLDCENAISARREQQLRIKDLEQQLGIVSQDNTVLKHRNSYVLVLMDGDGLIFKEHLVKQGYEGGKKAANALRMFVAAQCDNPEETKIIANVYADLSSLHKTMYGSITSETNLKDFMLGFTEAEASFAFIDVNGKARADKIKDTTRWNLRNYNCRHVLLGVAHDAGFAPFLSEVLRDDSPRRRVTVLEGYPAVEEITSTGVRSLSFDLFRTDRSPPPAYSTPNLQSASISYATVTGKASPPPTITLPLAPKSINTPTTRVASKPTQPPWNPGPRGIDPPLLVNQAVLEQIKKRKDNDKLCNNHYLRGPCAKGDECCFEHNHKPTPDELKCISFLARQNPCTNGQDCEVDNCIYGHHCPSVKDGVCTHPFCKFRPEEHPPGTKLKLVKKSYDY